MGPGIPWGWDQLAQAMPEDVWQGSTYVADSALIAEPALQKIRALGMHGLARLPATLGLCDRLKTEAWAKPDAAWMPLGILAEKEPPTSATYQAQALDTTGYGQPARAFVYPSSCLRPKKSHTLEREIAREPALLAKAAKKLAKHVFHCAEDALAASDRQRQAATIRWHAGTPTIIERPVVVRSRGRQKAGTEPRTATEYTVEWHWTPPTDQHLTEERHRRSAFILIPSDQTADARDTLRTYKAQDQNEHGFRFMKSPLHLTAWFLEKPEHIGGLGYALLLAVP